MVLFFSDSFLIPLLISSSLLSTQFGHSLFPFTPLEITTHNGLSSCLFYTISDWCHNQIPGKIITDWPGGRINHILLIFAMMLKKQNNLHFRFSISLIIELSPMPKGNLTHPNYHTIVNRFLCIPWSCPNCDEIVSPSPPLPIVWSLFSFNRTSLFPITPMSHSSHLTISWLIVT